MGGGPTDFIVVGAQAHSDMQNPTPRARVHRASTRSRFVTRLRGTKIHDEEIFPVQRSASSKLRRFWGEHMGKRLFAGSKPFHLLIYASRLWCKSAFYRTVLSSMDYHSINESSRARIASFVECDHILAYVLISLGCVRARLATAPKPCCSYLRLLASSLPLCG